MRPLRITTVRTALLAAALLGTAANLPAQIVFTEDFDDNDISDWTAGSERFNHPFGTPDVWYAPLAVGGAVKLQAKGSCFSAPFDGLASTLTKTIGLPNGTYYVSYTVSHSTTLYGFCSGGTGGDSGIFVNGLLISPASCGVGGSCDTCVVPTAAVGGCFTVVDGMVELKLRTSGGDCADVIGEFDNITITAVPDSDGDGIADVCDADDDNDGVPDEADDCDNSNLSATVAIGGCDSGVPNVLFANGCTISDLIAHCAAGATNHGEFVSCVSQLTNALKDQGVITGKQKGAIQSCAAKANIP